MPTAKVKVILNPRAGRGYGGRVEPLLRQALRLAGVDFDLERTAYHRHAIELAAQAVAAGYETVIAAGGDGTVQEVINGLLQDPHSSATLGVIPVGSGSDFAYALNIPADLDGACRVLARRRTRTVDLGRVTVDRRESRYFDNTVNVGFGGIVAVEAAKIHWLRGMAPYLLAVIKTIFLAPYPQVAIRYDEGEVRLRTALTCVANGPREGGGFLTAPDARLDDGLFDLIITGPVGRLAMFGLIFRFIKGSHLSHPLLQAKRTRRVTITSEDALIAHADGEILCTAAHHLEFEILPARLTVWA